MEDPLHIHAACSEAVNALDALAAALARLRDLDPDPTVQGMLDSLLEGLEEAGEQLHVYRQELAQRGPISPA